MSASGEGGQPAAPQPAAAVPVGPVSQWKAPAPVHPQGRAAPLPLPPSNVNVQNPAALAIAAALGPDVVSTIPRPNPSMSKQTQQVARLSAFAAGRAVPVSRGQTPGRFRAFSGRGRPLITPSTAAPPAQAPSGETFLEYVLRTYGTQTTTSAQRTSTGLQSNIARRTTTPATRAVPLSAQQIIAMNAAHVRNRVDLTKSVNARGTTLEDFWNDLEGMGEEGRLASVQYGTLTGTAQQPTRTSVIEWDDEPQDAVVRYSEDLYGRPGVEITTLDGETAAFYEYDPSSRLFYQLLPGRQVVAFLKYLTG